MNEHDFICLWVTEKDQSQRNKCGSPNSGKYIMLIKSNVDSSNIAHYKVG